MAIVTNEVAARLERVGYVLRERTQVAEFLDQYSFLTSLLLEAPAPIARHFPDAPMFLEIFEDTESDEQDRHLVINIGTELGPKEVIAKLRTLQKDWWLDRLPVAKGRLSIGFEYA
jgi:hypothetical protein